jgi:tRNA threonylcarbamoyladenosine biosynthesis protein TsaB
MRVLGIDTATHCGGIAILEDEQLLASLVLNIKKTHSERLLRDVDYLMKECELEMRDTDGIAVCIGPGSFTGVRIGMACAKGLAFASGKPLVGVSSLLALAERNAEPGILICPVLDARRSEIFGAAYRVRDNSRDLMEALPGRAEPLEQFLLQIKESALFCGEGSIKFRDKIKNILGERAHFASALRNLPSAVEIALLGMKRLVSGEQDDLAKLSPLYLRAHDAIPPTKSHDKR